MQASTLYDRPDLYDLVMGSSPAMERFYAGMARPGARVLELACGSGRLTVPLAEAGAHVVGGDLSPAMLERALQAATARGAEIELVVLDMRDFDLGGRLFDAVILAANSVLHLSEPEEFAGLFRCVARHLAPGGRLIFDAFIPSLALLGSDPATRHLVGRFEDPALGSVTLEETISYDPITQVSDVTWYWSTDAEPDFWTCDLKMRQIFPREMPHLVALGGLRLVERFGDFGRGPLSAESHRQICVCAPA